jgi:hypothetical protein
MTCGFVIDRGLECKAIPKLLHLTSPSPPSLALLFTSLSYTSLKLRHLVSILLQAVSALEDPK